MISSMTDVSMNCWKAEYSRTHFLRWSMRTCESPVSVNISTFSRSIPEGNLLSYLTLLLTTRNCDTRNPRNPRNPKRTYPHGFPFNHSSSRSSRPYQWSGCRSETACWWGGVRSHVQAEYWRPNRVLGQGLVAFLVILHLDWLSFWKSRSV